MRLKTYGVALAVAMMSAPAANAQLSSMMQGVMGGGSGGIGGMSMPSLGSANPTNLAGILQYCVQNNYLGGASSGAAVSAKQSLLDKFTGSSSNPTSNAGFSSGSNGLLNTGNGQSMSLGGGGLKAQITQKICGQVLKHAQSLL